MIDSVRLPCAIGPPNGLSSFARSMSTWIHWWSPDTSAKVLIMSWETSRQSLGPICWPTISFSPSIPSMVMGAMPGGYPPAHWSGRKPEQSTRIQAILPSRSGPCGGKGGTRSSDDLTHDLECALDPGPVHVKVRDGAHPVLVHARELDAGRSERVPGLHGVLQVEHHDVRLDAVG